MFTVSQSYLAVDNKDLHMKVTGSAAAPLVNLFRDFFLTWIKDEVFVAIATVLTRALPNSLNG